MEYIIYYAAAIVLALTPFVQLGLAIRSKFKAKGE